VRLIVLLLTALHHTHSQRAEIATNTTTITSANARTTALERQIAEQLLAITYLEEKAHSDESVRRKLHNAVQELKGVRARARGEK
jgi:hypothetical protein